MNGTSENGISVRVCGVNTKGQTVYNVILHPTRGRITLAGAEPGSYVLESSISEGCAHATIRKWIRTARRLKRWIRRCLSEYFKT